MSDIHPIEFAAGDTVVLQVSCLLNQAVFDLTGYSMYFTLRTQPAPADLTDANALIKKTTGGSGIIITNAAGGIAEILLDVIDTKTLPVGINLFYDVRTKSAGGAINTVADGIIVVEQPQTLRIY